MATNTNITPRLLLPLGGITVGDNDAFKVGWVDSGAKAAQNDTWTILGATTVYFFAGSLDATGVSEANTISGNVITLTGVTGTACSGLILYK